jgi:hypothetical protein
MADYKELLRRAISALPENNGAARRAVYEKARAALVGQLRAIQPPLPAREITQHRLQLEDCIRQVEQEASEAVISLGRDALLGARPAPTPSAEPIARPRQPEPVEAQPEPLPRPEPEPKPAVVAAPVYPASPVVLPTAKPVEQVAPAPVVVEPEHIEPEPEPEAPAEEPVVAAIEAADPEADGPLSIEEIIGEAAQTSGARVESTRSNFVNPFANSDDSDSMPSAPATNAAVPLKRPSILPRRDASASVSTAANAGYSSAKMGTRVEPSLGSSAALARQPQIEPEISIAPPPVEAALSAVREVEVDQDDAREAEGAIERAIETLDREARGEQVEPVADPTPLSDVVERDFVDETSEPTAFEPGEDDRRSGAGVTIFLIVFALLLVSAGGAGFWAWREGYVDLNQMFGASEPAVAENTEVPVPMAPTLDAPGVSETTTGPGNTATTTTSEPTTAIQGLEPDDRLAATPQPVTPNGSESVLPSLSGGEAKTEERLSDADTRIANVDDPANSVDPSVLAGSQSLLLEASADGRTGAVPFSGTVDWKKGEDELGLPTLVGEASIPARNLNVALTIRKNSDPSLPASHLLEVNFNVNDTFVGGSISSLPGVLLKNEELVPGTPLVGASARIVGNSFLFALSSSPDDLKTNAELLSTRRWLDLAIVYGTGRNAILTLEKDPDAEALFKEVFSAWGQS